ncbi:alpha/beta hydrolase-fold protein [Roseivirga misakiensis]|uniref:Esterase n=1 Tax=Roseivirga misakiensis TaxID=1563681 RepID=A0A1E5SL28_9BACT|nr:alpha/beta hydrolase-fold protein [Roseivirga misakiensis]OEJ99829.1 hypothetical protein BFP71_09775 [Roseivirga misakiensis]
MKRPLSLLLLLNSFVAFAQNGNIEVNTYRYITDSIYSDYLQDYRTVKIYLPEGYTEDSKYPVIYTLDGEWLFEPTTTEVKKLIDFDVLPKSIVVGIFHKNRNQDLEVTWKTGQFKSKSNQFYKFLTLELVPKLDDHYATSGFNTLIGHSNSATFSAKVLTEEKQPFRGFIALSQNLFGNQLNEYINFSKQEKEKPIFYYVASGKRDAIDRLESGQQLDSLFNINQNKHLITRHDLFDADHDGVAAKGLDNGIIHVFSSYKRHNDWEEDLIDELWAKGIKSMDFLNTHKSEMANIYGIDYKFNKTDLGFMKAMAMTNEEIAEIQAFEIANFEISRDFYSGYAQLYEAIKSYDKALEYWNLRLEKNMDEDIHPFYYRRAVELLHVKMKAPEKAIEFARKWREIRPNLSPYFNLWISRIAVASGKSKDVGLASIREYIKNYDSDFPGDLTEARAIESELTETSAIEKEKRK